MTFKVRKTRDDYVIIACGARISVWDTMSRLLVGRSKWKGKRGRLIYKTTRESQARKVECSLEGDFRGLIPSIDSIGIIARVRSSIIIDHHTDTDTHTTLSLSQFYSNTIWTFNDCLELYYRLKWTT